MAHGLQGQIAAWYGKRIVRHMPQIIGAWVAGVFDSDKAVSKSAQDSFRIAFTSEEKLNGVWKIYQAEIAIFCQDFFEGESPNTLSDERSTSPDDAYNKFSRTLAATILTLAHLIGIYTCIMQLARAYHPQRNFQAIWPSVTPPSTRS